MAGYLNKDRDYDDEEIFGECQCFSHGKESSIRNWTKIAEEIKYGQKWD